MWGLRRLIAPLACGLAITGLAEARDDVSSAMRTQLDTALEALYGGRGASDAKYCVDQTRTAVAAVGGDANMNGETLNLVRDALTARFAESQTYTCGALALQMFFVFPPSDGVDAAKFASTVGIVVDASARALEQADAPDPAEAGLVGYSQAVVSYLASDLPGSSGKLCEIYGGGFNGARPVLETWPEPVNCPALDTPEPASPTLASAPAQGAATAIPGPAPTPAPVSLGDHGAAPPPTVSASPPAGPAPSTGHLPVATAPAAPEPVPAAAEASLPTLAYKNCRKIVLDYEDPDGNPAEEIKIMCQDETDQFVEVEGLE